MKSCRTTPTQRKRAELIVRPRIAARAFSLSELLVVIAVTVLLTGLLLPGMRQLHENAHRIMCASNMMQLSKAFTMYAGDHNDLLPESCTLKDFHAPQDLMISRRVMPMAKWDGLGLLYAKGYCSSPECFYCPSHRGEHPYERYMSNWPIMDEPTQIFTNYHYSGDTNWEGVPKRRRLSDGINYVLLTDGLRTTGDFNHITGMNVLRADGSIRWREDVDGIYNLLPSMALDVAPPTYQTIWGVVEARP